MSVNLLSTVNIGRLGRGRVRWRRREGGRVGRTDAVEGAGKVEKEGGRTYKIKEHLL